MATYVFFGMVNGIGEAELIYFSYTTDFSPLFLRGVYGVGMQSACGELQKRLARVEESLPPPSGDPSSSGVEQWAIQLAGQLYYGVIAPGEERTVGGWVQMAILDSRGWRDLQVETASQDPLKAESWQRITAQHQELKRYTEMYKVPHLASGDFDLDLTHISH
ncbi:MAG TPA: hypothetical protein VNL15_04905 [Dehalococcoidia bacterium]|nr:hypothetical protein [Dehalococcoidia bacterium]